MRNYKYIKRFIKNKFKIQFSMKKNVSRDVFVKAVTIKNRKPIADECNIIGE